METGLYYNRFRYYDPEAGSYISQDFIGLNGGYNLYSYVKDTNSYLDQYGLTDEAIFDTKTNKWRNPQTGRFTKDPWSRTPKSIQDRMTLDAAKQGQGTKIIDNLGDPRFQGMEKWELKVKSAEGRTSNVHYVRDPQTGNLYDFKFKKHSICP